MDRTQQIFRYRLRLGCRLQQPGVDRPQMHADLGFQDFTQHAVHRRRRAIEHVGNVRRLHRHFRLRHRCNRRCRCLACASHVERLFTSGHTVGYVLDRQQVGVDAAAAAQCRIELGQHVVSLAHQCKHRRTGRAAAIQYAVEHALDLPAELAQGARANQAPTALERMEHAAHRAQPFHVGRRRAPGRQQLAEVLQLFVELLDEDIADVLVDIFAVVDETTVQCRHRCSCHGRGGDSGFGGFLRRYGFDGGLREGIEGRRSGIQLGQEGRCFSVLQDGFGHVVLSRRGHVRGSYRVAFGSDIRRQRAGGIARTIVRSNKLRLDVLQLPIGRRGACAVLLQLQRAIVLHAGGDLFQLPGTRVGRGLGHGDRFFQVRLEETVGQRHFNVRRCLRGPDRSGHRLHLQFQQAAVEAVGVAGNRSCIAFCRNRIEAAVQRITRQAGLGVQMAFQGDRRKGVGAVLLRRRFRCNRIKSGALRRVGQRLRCGLRNDRRFGNRHRLGVDGGTKHQGIFLTCSCRGFRQRRQRRRPAGRCDSRLGRRILPCDGSFFESFLLHFGRCQGLDQRLDVPVGSGHSNMGSFGSIVQRRDGGRCRNRLHAPCAVRHVSLNGGRWHVLNRFDGIRARNRVQAPGRCGDRFSRRHSHHRRGRCTGQRPIVQRLQAAAGDVEDVLAARAAIAQGFQVVLKAGHCVGQGVQLAATGHALALDQFNLDVFAHRLQVIRRCRQVQHAQRTGNLAKQARHFGQALVVPAGFNEGDKGLACRGEVGDGFVGQHLHRAAGFHRCRIVLTGSTGAQVGYLVVQRCIHIEQRAGDIQQQVVVDVAIARHHVAQRIALLGDDATGHAQAHHAEGVGDSTKFVHLHLQVGRIATGAYVQVQRILDAHQFFLDRTAYRVQQLTVAPAQAATGMLELGRAGVAGVRVEGEQHAFVDAFSTARSADFIEQRQQHDGNVAVAVLQALQIIRQQHGTAHQGGTGLLAVGHGVLAHGIGQQLHFLGNHRRGIQFHHPQGALHLVQIAGAEAHAAGVAGLLDIGLNLAAHLAQGLVQLGLHPTQCRVAHGIAQGTHCTPPCRIICMPSWRPCIAV